MTANDDKKRVLITGGRGGPALDLARILSANGHQVWVGDSLPNFVSSFSRLASKTVLLPAPNDGLDAFAEGLANLIEEAQIDVLIPICEEAFHVSRVRERLPKRCAVFVDDIIKMRRLHSKDAFIRFAAELGFAVPETTLVTSREQVLDVLRTGRDVVLKRVFSRFSAGTVILPRDEQDLAQVDVSPEVPWIVQTYLGTRQFCTYSVVVRGRIQAHTTYGTTHTAGQGASLYFHHTEHAEIYAWIEGFVKAIEYTGQIAFDFMEHENGTVMPIECNPRATSGLHLFRASDDLGRAFFGAPEDVIIPGEGAHAMIAIGMLIYALPTALRQGMLGRWWHDFRRAREVSFSWRDPLPAFGQFLQVFQVMRVARAHKISFLEATTVDIEWDGDAPELLMSASPEEQVS